MNKIKKRIFIKKPKLQNLKELIIRKNLKQINLPPDGGPWLSVKNGWLPEFNEVVVGKAIHKGYRYFAFFKRVKIGESGWRWGVCNDIYVACNEDDEFDSNENYNVIEWFSLGKAVG